MLAALIAALLFFVPFFARSGEENAGQVSIPYIFGDAGMVTMQAGVFLPVTWSDPPPDAALYVLLWDSHYSRFPALIGVDTNAVDGVIVQWKIPERLGGMPFGVAIYADGRIVHSHQSHLEYGSGSAPPEGICTVGYSGMDGANIFGGEQPTTDFWLGQLEGYAPVLERVVDAQGIGWLSIALSEAIIYRYDKSAPLPEKGWIPDQWVRLFGDCTFLDD
jgi:hypothetical protein